MALSAPGRQIARNTLVVGASFALAAGMGLLRDMIVARQFGIGADLDTYYAAFRLPDLLFSVVAGGALATAFIPVLAGFLSNNDREGAWRLTSATINLVVLAVSGLAALAALFAPVIVGRMVAPGFTPAQQGETAALMRLVLASTVVFGASAVLTSVLHGHKRFLLPALAPVVYPLGTIAGALWLVPAMGVRGLALGAVAGALLHLLVQVPGVVRCGFRWRPVLGLQLPEVRRVLWLMGPRVLDLGVWHLTLLATTNLASRLDSGSVAALEWGWNVMQFPETIIGTAVGLVALPTLADLAARRDVPGLRRTLSESLRAVLVLTVPASVGLVVLGRPLLGMLYERGAFGAAAGDAVYLALRWYALGLVGHACLELVVRAFCAQQDTVRPLLVAAVWSAVSVGFGAVLMAPMGHGGLALANSLAITGELLTLLVILRRRWQGIDADVLLATLGRSAGATLAMGVAMAGAVAVLEGAGAGSPVAVAGGAVTGSLVYLSTAALLRLRELRWPIQIILGRRVAVD